MKSTDSSTQKGIESLARIGYAAKGIVYSLVGVLAAMATFGLGGQTTDTKGAIKELAGQPFGQIMLATMALGLAGYVVWRFTQGFADTEDKGNDFKGIGARAGLILSGLIYASLAVYTVRLLITAGGDGGGSSTQDRTAKLMAYPGGIWLVGAIGIGVIGVGLYQAWRAYTQSFKNSWNTAAMSQTQEQWATRIARTGISARALIFAVIGTFLVIAAVQANPDKARGLAGALDTLAAQPFGPWILAAVGLAFVCYGIYCFVNARFRHVDS